MISIVIALSVPFICNYCVTLPPTDCFFFFLVEKAYYCAGILKQLFQRKNEKNVEEARVPGRKRKHSIEEIKRVKKNEITKQKKRNVTITGRNVQL